MFNDIMYIIAEKVFEMEEFLCKIMELCTASSEGNE